MTYISLDSHLFSKFCSVFHPIISGWELSHFFLNLSVDNSNLLQSTSLLIPWPSSTVKMLMSLPKLLSLDVPKCPFLQAPVQLCVPYTLYVTEPCCAVATPWWMPLSLLCISPHCLTQTEKLGSPGPTKFCFLSSSFSFHPQFNHRTRAQARHLVGCCSL